MRSPALTLPAEPAPEFRDSPEGTGNLFWRLQAAGWGGTALLMIVFSGLELFRWRDAILFGGFRTAFGLAATFWVLRPIYRRWRRRGGELWKLAAAVFLLCGVLSLADAAATTAFMLAFAGQDATALIEQVFLPSSFLRGAIYLLWSLLYFAIHYRINTENARLRLAQAEGAARAGELQMLRAQVNPHFLFNALNSILAESGNPAAVRSLTLALAECLRFSLRQQGDLQPLGAELDMLENYLCVEKARFEEKLEYAIEATPAARQTPAPAALVQPLLDNAIKYGQRSAIRPLRLHIAARVEEGALVISVRNTGEWIAPGTIPSTGTGIANLRRRLQLLYGASGLLTFETPPGEVRATARLPVGGKKEGLP